MPTTGNGRPATRTPRSPAWPRLRRLPGRAAAVPELRRAYGARRRTARPRAVLARAARAAGYAARRSRGPRVSTEPPSVPPVPADSGPFLEAFAIYLCTQIVLMLIIALVFRSSRLEMEWLLVLFLPVWFLWPVWRGVSRAELRRGLGWHRGRGVLREMAAGVGGYVGGLPLLVAAILVTAMLNRITHTQPEHPIQFEVGKGWWTTLQVYLLACVWAPFVEETMFRGALFHHLRQRWRWLAAAPLVAFLFAAVHPQGWTTIPVLGRPGRQLRRHPRMARLDHRLHDRALPPELHGRDVPGVVHVVGGGRIEDGGWRIPGHIIVASDENGRRLSPSGTPKGPRTVRFSGRVLPDRTRRVR